MMRKVLALVVASLMLVLSVIPASAASTELKVTKKEQYYQGTKIPKQIIRTSVLGDKKNGPEIIEKYDSKYGLIFKEITHYVNGVKQGAYEKTEVAETSESVETTMTTARYSKGKLDGKFEQSVYKGDPKVRTDLKVINYKDGVKSGAYAITEYLEDGKTLNKKETGNYINGKIDEKSKRTFERINCSDIPKWFPSTAAFINYDNHAVLCKDGSIVNEDSVWSNTVVSDERGVPIYRISYPEKTKEIGEHYDRASKKYIKVVEIDKQDGNKKITRYKRDGIMIESVKNPNSEIYNLGKSALLTRNSLEDSYTCKLVATGSPCEGQIEGVTFKSGSPVSGSMTIDNYNFISEMDDLSFDTSVVINFKDGKQNKDKFDSITYYPGTNKKLTESKVTGIHSDDYKVEGSVFDQNGVLALSTVIAGDVDKSEYYFSDGSKISGSVSSLPMEFVATDKDGNKMNGAIEQSSDFISISGIYKEGLLDGVVKLFNPETLQFQVILKLKNGRTEGKDAIVAYDESGEVDRKLNIEITENGLAAKIVMYKPGLDMPASVTRYKNKVMDGEQSRTEPSMFYEGVYIKYIATYENDSMKSDSTELYNDKRKVESRTDSEVKYYLEDGSVWKGVYKLDGELSEDASSAFSPDNYKSFTCTTAKSKPCSGKQIYRTKEYNIVLVFTEGKVDSNSKREYTRYNGIISEKTVAHVSKGKVSRQETYSYVNSKPYLFVSEVGTKTNSFHIAEDGSAINMDTLICTSGGKPCNGLKKFKFYYGSDHALYGVEANYNSGKLNGAHKLTHNWPNSNKPKNTIVTNYKNGKEIK